MTDPVFGDESLKFPLDCQFRVIAEDRPNMHFVLETVLMQLGIESPLEKGNVSSAGKYVTYYVNVTVESQEMMTRIDSALRNVEGVKMVL